MHVSYRGHHIISQKKSKSFFLVKLIHFELLQQQPRFALLVEIELELGKRHVLSEILDMEVQPPEADSQPSMLVARFRKGDSIQPFSWQEALLMTISVAVIRKCDGALKTLCKSCGINDNETLRDESRALFLEPDRASVLSSRIPEDYEDDAMYFFDIYTLMSGEAVVALTSFRIEFGNPPLPLKSLIARWAELGEWM